MPMFVLAREFYDGQVDTRTGDVTWCNECVLVCTKLYCLVTEAQCDKLVIGFYDGQLDRRTSDMT